MTKETIMTSQENKENAKIIGTNDIDKSKENTYLEKNEIMFLMDEDGIALPEEFEVEIYDKTIDDEIFLTTLELDNALTMNDSIKSAFKKTVNNINSEISKLEQRISNLTKDKGDNSLIEKTKIELETKRDNLIKVGFENDMRIEMCIDKIKESRKDLDNLEKMRDEKKVLRKVKLIPCTVAESNKYFNKRMFKDDKGEWKTPKDSEDTTWITSLLTEKVIVPKLTFKEWEMAKPSMRLCFKDAIGTISEFHKPSPKEILVNNRRSEKLKNLDGELQ